MLADPDTSLSLLSFAPEPPVAAVSRETAFSFFALRFPDPSPRSGAGEEEDVGEGEQAEDRHDREHEDHLVRVRVRVRLRARFRVRVKVRVRVWANSPRCTSTARAAARSCTAPRRARR